MYRFVAILMIPFCVVGSSLAHSHGSPTHPSPSQGRAHIHVGSASQHFHSHASHGHSHHVHGQSHEDGHERDSNDSSPGPVENPVGHESDAVYVTAADFLVTTSSRVSIEVDSCAVVETVEYCLSAIFMPSRLERPPLATTFGRPLYLLHAALRL